MKLTQITSAQLTEIARLVEEKESLLKRVSEINKALQDMPVEGRGRGWALMTMERISGRAGRHPGKLKAAVLEALAAASPEGLTVKQLSAKLGVKTNNLYSWFYTTGKKIEHLEKTVDGRYIYTPAETRKIDQHADSGG